MLKIQKLLISLMLVLTLTAESVAFSVSAAEVNDNNESSLLFSESDDDNDLRATKFFDYVLNNTEEQYQMSYTAGSSGEQFYLSTLPSGGSVTLYVRDARWNGNTLYTRVFDIYGYSGRQKINMSPNDTFYFFLKADYASTSGTVNRANY